MPLIRQQGDLNINHDKKLQRGIEDYQSLQPADLIIHNISMSVGYTFTKPHTLDNDFRDFK